MNVEQVASAVKDLSRAAGDSSLPEILERIVANDVLTWGDLEQASTRESLADILFANDIAKASSVTQHALSHLGVRGDEALQLSRSHVRHKVWAWLRTHRGGAPLSHRVEGREHYRRTEGRPTIVVSIMTGPAQDAMLGLLAETGSRTVHLYAEQQSVARRLAGASSRLFVHARSKFAVRHILRGLASGGMFVTYADFVYEGHGIDTVHPFGVPRRASSSFIRLCAMRDVVLLPVSARFGPGSMTMRFLPPVEVESGERTSGNSKLRIVQALIAVLIERLVLESPTQWLLLETLSAESEYRLAPLSQVSPGG